MIILQLVPVLCSDCKLNFCLSHRHTADHECKGPMPAHLNGQTASKSALVAIKTSEIERYCSQLSMSNPVCNLKPVMANFEIDALTFAVSHLN